MSRGEFENRDNELGDLPEDILKERKERGQNILSNDVGIPPDLAWQTKLRGQKEVLGSPATGAKVVSTFDVRPINAGDFNSIGAVIVTGA